jgi:excisionase family DNA binding protein
VSNEAPFLSVDQVARQLGMHVRTVRRYLREGTLKGVRIGKQYRVSPADLAALTGQHPSGAQAPIRLLRHVEASAVVQVDAISPNDAIRIANGIGGAVQGCNRSTNTPLRVDTVYDEGRARLKIIIVGDLTVAVGLMRMLEIYVGADDVNPVPIRKADLDT